MAQATAAWLHVGQTPSHGYTQTEAETVLLGYAFARGPLGWRRTPRVPLTFTPTSVEPYLWGYAAYDCRPSTPHGLTLSDVLVTATLDSRIGAKTALEIMSVGAELASYLRRIPINQNFWDLTRTRLASFAGGTAPETYLWRAWCLLNGLDTVGPTITHKVLHHKRPWLFPLLDGRTLKAYPTTGAWTGLYDDLHAHEEEFVALEAWFAREAGLRSAMPLTRLRIHDILLWAKQSSGQLTPLMSAGNVVRATPPQRLTF